MDTTNPAPLTALVRAMVRPESWTAQAREAVALGVTAAHWPFGFVDRGLSEFRSRAFADRSPKATPVLLIHGYGANKSNWFFVERALRQAGYERLHGLNYNPLRMDIPAIAEAATQRARALMEHFGVERIHLVGHSTGGLVARYAVQVNCLENVGVCATVASPHQGTPMARLGAGTTARQLRPGSDVVRLLRSSARPLSTKFVAFYSNVDVLSPGHRSRIIEPALEATNVLIKDHGHLSLLLSRPLGTALAAHLAAADAAAGAAVEAAPGADGAVPTRRTA